MVRRRIYMQFSCDQVPNSFWRPPDIFVRKSPRNDLGGRPTQRFGGRLIMDLLWRPTRNPPWRPPKNYSEADQHDRFGGRPINKSTIWLIAVSAFCITPRLARSSKLIYASETWCWAASYFWLANSCMGAKCGGALRRLMIRGIQSWGQHIIRTPIDLDSE